MTASADTLITAGGALFAVLLLVLVAARLLRMGGWAPRPLGGKTRSLRESLALDTRRRLHLVQCGQKQIVLLTGGAQDVVVGWIDP